jgi:hypothetical protein
MAFQYLATKRWKKWRQESDDVQPIPGASPAAGLMHPPRQVARTKPKPLACRAEGYGLPLSAKHQIFFAPGLAAPNTPFTFRTPKLHLMGPYPPARMMTHAPVFGLLPEAGACAYVAGLHAPQQISKNTKCVISTEHRGKGARLVFTYLLGGGSAKVGCNNKTKQKKHGTRKR